MRADEVAETRNALTAEGSLSRYVPTYAYEFADENAPEVFLPPEGFPYGAAHASEIQYLFTLNLEAFPATLAPAQQQLATTMRGYWTNLATFGTPAGGWPRFSASHPVWRDLVPPRPVKRLVWPPPLEPPAMLATASSFCFLRANSFSN